MRRLESITNCDKTLQLVRKSLKAGYIHPDTGEHIRSTEVLDEFDKQVEKIKSSFDQGNKRARNKEYAKLQSRIQ
uniref:WGS project CBMF000000000 data, contig CS5834_c000900 n=1 Tax=Fusarium pseudograminearum CS5834 TaxID=1318459 RepID=A0A096PFH5_FUSPS|nr:unnamed protein product [Fusarium pseudograminearum CS5834]